MIFVSSLRDAFHADGPDELVLPMFLAMVEASWHPPEMASRVGWSVFRPGAPGGVSGGVGEPVEARTRGDHHQYKQPSKPGLVTGPGRMNDELAPGTISSGFKQAGLKS